VDVTAKNRPGRGRPKGRKNKVTEDIRALVHRRVDYDKVVKALEKRAVESSDRAAQVLLEYGFGKPVESVNVNASISQTEIARTAAEVLYSAGSGFISPPDKGLPLGPSEVQDSPRGATVVQDGDSKADTSPKRPD